MDTRRNGKASTPAAIAWLFAIAVAAALPGTALAVDWTGVPEHEVALFYPGQASWEWALTEKDHSGAPKFREGKNCKGCHEGEQADIGAAIVGGEKLEAAPIAGKPGHLLLRVQAARDAERLYFRLRWTGAPASGTKLDPDVAARVTVMLGTEQVKEAMRAGCWGSCHDDNRGMVSAEADSTRSKYLASSRSKLSRKGGGKNIKPDADLQALLGQGAFLEYWQAKLNPGQPAQPSSGYVLDKRHRHETPVALVEATQSGDEWTVVLSGPLKAGGPGQLALENGKTYAVGFAVHDDFADHRFHHVSLEQSLSLDGGTADIVAKAQ